MKIKSAIAIELDPDKKAYWACIVIGQYDDRNSDKPIRIIKHNVSGAAETEDQIITLLMLLATSVAGTRFCFHEIDIRFLGEFFQSYKILVGNRIINAYQHTGFDNLPKNIKHLYAKARESAKSERSRKAV